jgi:hypothetical protein
MPAWGIEDILVPGKKSFALENEMIDMINITLKTMRRG